jgi:hypothetical protein
MLFAFGTLVPFSLSLSLNPGGETERRKESGVKKKVVPVEEKKGKKGKKHPPSALFACSLTLLVKKNKKGATFPTAQEGRAFP